MSGSQQVLTEREAELLDYYRNVIDRTATLKVEDDGGKLPDGFPSNRSAISKRTYKTRLEKWQNRVPQQLPWGPANF